MKISIILTIIYASHRLISRASGEFVPTNEWQIVEEGEQIPPGLHVRLNFNTGVREAKLLSPEDETDDTDDGLVVVIPNSDVAEDDEKSDLEEYFEELKLSANTPPELSQAIQHIKSQLMLQHDLLQNLADLAHDIEYGTILVNSALPELVNIILNRDQHDVEFRNTAARALGASLRNNPDSLKVALGSKAHVVPRLLKGLQVESDLNVQSRLLYVISACLDDDRGLEQYIQSNGGDIIRKLFQSRGEAAASQPGYLTFQRKCCDLIQDQLINRDDSRNKFQEQREDELKKWASILQQSLIDHSDDHSIEVKYKLFQTLVNIKEIPALSISIEDKFLSWLAEENNSQIAQHKRGKVASGTIRLQSNDDTTAQEGLSPTGEDSDSEYLSIEEKYHHELKRARHLVFGNPKAHRNHLGDDL
ncbi:Sil1p [Sugiyamaella lignohabitans]|uniref:Nucleotide exchange factor SIL1 n=1 Tax=Sugiyamaella lignohabitans TaxID=796027 RepID=A0A167FXF4_9ASCO|nr:Sil1p [Sugiyamaella lignohabitans]ANB15828.1 Sil1p [Sugiyamaella lignohabitans]